MTGSAQIHVAPSGKIDKIGNDNTRDVQAQLQITVATPDGGTDTAFDGYEVETAGLFEGTLVAVYGTFVDTETFVTTFGGRVTQPLVIAPDGKRDDAWLPHAVYRSIPTPGSPRS